MVKGRWASHKYPLNNKTKPIIIKEVKPKYVYKGSKQYPTVIFITEENVDTIYYILSGTTDYRANYINYPDSFGLRNDYLEITLKNFIKQYYDPNFDLSKFTKLTAMHIRNAFKQVLGEL